LEPIFVNRTIIALSLAAALSGAFVCLPHVRGQNPPTAARAPKPAPSLKIAVVDFPTILREYRKVIDKRREMNGIAEDGNAKIRQLQGEGQALLKQEGSLDQESNEFQEHQKMLYQLENSIKTTKASAERDMKTQNLKISLEVYQDLQGALKLFSQRNDLALVLRIDSDAALAKDYRGIGQTLGQHIIYNRHLDDITAAVLSYLNRQYESAAKDSGREVSSETASPAKTPSRTLPALPNRKPAHR
jgi:Skp family chaperone for outer membrane proteins